MKGKKKSKYQKIESRARKYYEKWRKTGSFSPALNEIIHVTRLGWNHLIDPRKRRTKRQKAIRLEALPLAKKLIETSTTYQEKRRDKGLEYYAFVAEIEGRRIKTVVSSKNGGKKVFLSVIVLR
jgi:hypothetical protein